MIISCPQCATSFRADGSKIAPTGTKVRCAKCGHVWVQKPEAATAAPAPKPVPVPEARPAPRPAPPTPEPGPPPIEAVPARVPQDEPSAFRAPEPPVPQIPAPRVPEISPPDEPVAEEPAAESRAERRAREIEARTYKAAQRRDLEEMEKPRRKGGFLSFIGWIVFLAVLGGALYGAIAYRTQIVNFWPKTATLYKTVGLPVNLSGLELRNIAYDRQFADGVPVLVLEGEVLNKGGAARNVPKLRASLRDAKGKELYFWTFAAQSGRLGPGELSAFSSRLPSPPVESEQLIVTFALGN